MDGKSHLEICFLTATYCQGWDDCLDVLLSMLGENDATVKSKIVNLQTLVKAKKFKQFRAEFEVIDKLF